MFIHLKYKFHSPNANISKESEDIDKQQDEYWQDVFTVNDNSMSEDEQYSNDIPINMNSTLKAIREFVKKHKLGIKCGGKGRTKAVILEDIENMMKGKMINGQTNDQETEEMRSNTISNQSQSQSQVFSIPFGSFYKCCNCSDESDDEF